MPNPSRMQALDPADRHWLGPNDPVPETDFSYRDDPRYLGAPIRTQLAIDKDVNHVTIHWEDHNRVGFGGIRGNGGRGSVQEEIKAILTFYLDEDPHGVPVAWIVMHCNRDKSGWKSPPGCHPGFQAINYSFNRGLGGWVHLDEIHKIRPGSRKRGAHEDKGSRCVVM